ncbi:hypothetical protein K445DRAFT_314360 [Daldinia sp. EC12]|nr:hypothetical protein F4774DRAFT_390594 [Daldinia eschscholtzii]OTB19471.1 hypothetical protein K445DRAFT_314360 [Daldinia sp. EC12]
MPSDASQKRTQFSSCDACRRSRVACDASKRGYQPGGVNWTGSCSRCALRRRPCTFQWINAAKRKPLNPDRGAASCSPPTETRPAISSESQILETIIIPTEQQSCDHAADQGPQSGTNSNVLIQNDINHITPPDELNGHSIQPPCTQVESADILLSYWCNEIFLHGFENIFSLIVGKNGCPFLDNPMSEIYIPPTQLFRKLDAYMDSMSNRRDSNSVEEDVQIDQSLKQAIQSFTAPRLPLIASRIHLTAGEVEEVIRESWRITRKDMLKVVNRTSYRSALTLYLFAQTPIPMGISEDEELDGISGLMCTQAALLQIQRLREQQQGHRIHATEGSGALTNPVPDANLLKTFFDFECRVHWAAVTWDTSNSLTYNIRTSLTSGLNGGCSEPAWRLARTFLLGSFHPRTDHWRTSGFDISDDVASRIITAAAVSMLYIWKNISSLKEALREGVEEEAVLFVWSAVQDASNMFKTSIRPLLNNLERRLHFLDQVSRFTWYGVNLQYNLGILTLSNTLESASRTDLLSQITKERQDAENESFNILKFGLDNTYTIYGRRRESNTANSSTSSDSFEDHIVVSLIALDPYPSYVVNTVLLINKAISREYRQGKIKHETYSYLLDILLKVIDQLPQSSKTIQAAKQTVKQTLHIADDMVDG